MRLLTVVTLLLLPAALHAQKPQTRDGFGISFGIGGGSASLDCNGCVTDSESGGTAYLRIGGYLRPNLFLAGESAGWAKSENNVDTTIGFLGAVAQWYPSTTNGFYLKGGLGIATYSEDDGVDEAKSAAGALSLGTGYDFRVGRNFSLTPFANLIGSGKGDLEVNGVKSGFKFSTTVFQIGLGFTWH